MLDTIKEFINPSKNPDFTQAHNYQKNNLPTLWLFGKTGAGKSSLIQSITGETSVEIGNGFEPCTKKSFTYNFPKNKPLMRFLDTRGLGEANYDPKEDLAEAAKASHALVVVMKIDEPEQAEILQTLKKIKKDNKSIKSLLLVHSAVLTIPESDRKRQIAYHQQQLEAVWGNEYQQVAVDFETEQGSIYQHEQLIEQLTKLLPVIGIMAYNDENNSHEESNFNKVKNEVLWYSGTAAATDTIPGIGLVSVPAIQAKMLHSLANQYGVDWNTRVFSEFIGSLGSSFALQYASKFGVRQLIKFVPYYGQTVGAVAAATMSFSTTYGLARAACYYFHCKEKGEEATPEQMKNVYKAAFNTGEAVSKNESI